MLSAHRDKFDGISVPIAKRLASIGFSPNTLTILGFVAGAAAAVFLSKSALGLALFFLIVASAFDVMDGAVARVSNRATDFGAYLDSLLDRYADALILIGVMLYLNGYYLLIAVVLVGTLLVSYARARAEALGMKGDVGFTERAERLLVLTVAVFLQWRGYNAIYPALMILAVGTHFTVLQRAYHIHASSNKK